MATKDIELFSKLLDEKFKGIIVQMDAEFKLLNSRVNNTNDILSRVEEQTKKTNGSVAAITARVIDLEKKDIMHLITCPQTAVIAEMKEDLLKKEKDLSDDLQEYHLLKKYPKIGLGIVIVTCILLAIGVYYSYSSLAKDVKEEIRTELKKDFK